LLDQQLKCEKCASGTTGYFHRRSAKEAFEFPTELRWAFVTDLAGSLGYRNASGDQRLRFV
jgi:hypothetical protein